MIQAVCWMLIHSLWEGGLCAVAAGLVLLGTKRAPSATRYSLLTGVFFLFLALAGYTLYREWPGEWMAWLSPDVPAQQRDPGGGFLNTCLVLVCGYISDHALLIVWAWMLICMYKCLRMTGGLLHLRRLRLECSPPPMEWMVRVEVLCTELGIRRVVELKESLRVSAPVVIGSLRPVILMPMGLLTGLPQGEIEAVLLHELAHIRRLDYSMNFLQRITETLFFFNPGLLWISALLRDEREHCCDDLAISRTRDKVQFIRALVSFREISMPSYGGTKHGPELALGFPSCKGQFLQRVERIVYNKNKTLRPGEKLLLLGSCMALGCFLAMPGRMPATASNSHAYVTILGGSREPIQSKRVAEVEGRNEESKAGQAKDEVQGVEDLERLKEKLSLEARIAEINESGAARFNESSAAHFNEMDYAERDERSDVAKNKDRAAKVKEARFLEEQEKKMQAMVRNLQDKRRKDMKVTDEQLAEIEVIRLKLEADRAQQDEARMSEERKLLQAEEDRNHIIRDREQAIADQQQAEKDRLQGLQDRMQADLDRKQAEAGRQEADLDRARSIENRRKAEIDRQHDMQAAIDRQHEMQAANARNKKNR
jgi:bla regulator protein BlaR1